MATIKKVNTVKRTDQYGNVLYSSPNTTSSNTTSSTAKLNPVSSYGLSSNSTLNPDGTPKTSNSSGLTKVSSNVTTGTSLNPDGTPKSSTPTSTYSYSSATNTYKPTFSTSDRTNNYANQLDDIENDKPDDFTSKYTSQIDQLLYDIDNPTAFNLKDNDTYNQLYNQYKESYMNQGQRAMRDTMGQASALTGGYGSTAANTAASQSYDNYMSQLNDQNANLANMALTDYWNNRNDNYNQLNAYQSQDAVDYGRYRDTVADWQLDRNYYNDAYLNNYNNDFNLYNSNLGQYNTENSMALQQAQLDQQKAEAAQAQQNWQTQWDYQLAQDALAQQASGSAGGSSGRSGSSRSGSSSSSSGYTSKPDTYGYYPASQEIINLLNKGKATDTEAYGSKGSMTNTEAYESILKYVDSQSGMSAADKSEMITKLLKETGVNEAAAIRDSNNTATEDTKKKLATNRGLYNSISYK